MLVIVIMTTFSSVPARSEPVALIVEDDDVLRELLCEVIHDMGWSVYTAGTADAGLIAFNDHRELDLVITDVTTPGTLNGWELASAVYAARPELPVIVTSGYCRQFDQALPPSACFLKKPWSINALCAMVEKRAGWQPGGNQAELA